jgi:hypothetical protein
VIEWSIDRYQEKSRSAVYCWRSEGFKPAGLQGIHSADWVVETALLKIEKLLQKASLALKFCGAGVVRWLRMWH